MCSRLKEMEISRIIKTSLWFQKWRRGGCEEDSWAEWWICPGQSHPQRDWCYRMLAVLVLGVTQRGNFGKAWRLTAETRRCSCCKLWLPTDKGAETWHEASTDKRCSCEDAIPEPDMAGISMCAGLPLCVGRTAVPRHSRALARNKSTFELWAPESSYSQGCFLRLEIYFRFAIKQ